MHKLPLLARLTSHLSVACAGLFFVAAAAACGGGTSGASDTQGDDPGTTEPPGDVSPTKAGCSVAVGAARVHVALHDSSGAVVSVVKTASDGLASWDECPVHSMISFAALEDSGSWRGATVMGVEPGDDIEVLLPGLGLVGGADVVVPQDGAAVEQVRVSAGPGCSKNSSEGATASLGIASSCVGDGVSLPVLATGKIGDARVYSYSIDKDLAIDDVTVVDDLSGWTTGFQITAAASNASSDNLLFNVESMRNGLSYTELTQLTNVVDGEASTLLPSAPSAFVTSRRVGVGTNGLSQQGIVRESTDLLVEFDASTFAPALGGVSVDQSDPTRPVMTLEGVPSGMDMMSLRATWLSGDTEVEWYILAPASNGAIQFPELPAELSGALPDGATVSSVATIDITGSDYGDILSRGYTVEEFWASCAVLPAGAECRFSNRYL